MNKESVEIGEKYYTLISGHVCKVIITDVKGERGRIEWDAVNERTGRKIHIKIAARLWRNGEGCKLFYGEN